MKKRIGIIAFLVIVLALGFIVGCFWMSSSIEPPNTFTDGIVTATFDKEAGTLIFSGDGEVAWVSQWVKLSDKDECKSVHTIIFEEGITSIGRYEFCTPLFCLANSEFPNVEKVIFEGDIDTIGTYAFYENSSLKEVEFRGECRLIEGGAFGGCPFLKKYNIPNECQVSPDAFVYEPWY